MHVARALLLAAVVMTGCSTRYVDWTRMDGSACRTTKVWPIWYSAETETDCIDKQSGRVENVLTSHSDISIAAGLIAVLATIGLTL